MDSKKLINCDLCKSCDLEHVYTPINSNRSLKVFICKNCGLVQSFPKIDHVNSRVMKASGDADWGNIRYGKGFRTKHNLDMIDRVRTIDSFSKCLDIGSNRGKFLIEINELNNDLEIWGVEPDSKILKSYSQKDNFKIINERIENASLPKNYFDLVYCSHTIEHLKSPLDSLIKINTLLKDGGIAFLEVPNIEFLKLDDIIEEFFIDKHLYHFSIKTFKNLVEKSGFEILSCSNNEEDEINISMVVTPNSRLKKNSIISDYKNSNNLINKYIQTHKSNLKHIKKIANKLNKIAMHKRLAIWGAGRIFDILVRKGGLDVSKLVGIFDKYLSEITGHTHGKEILNPKSLRSINPEAVFICSREYFDDISKEIVNINQSIDILGFSDEIKDNING